LFQLLAVYHFVVCAFLAPPFEKKMFGMLGRLSILLATWAASAPVVLAAFPTPIKKYEQDTGGGFILIMLVALLIAAPVVALVIRAEQKRRHNLQALADSLGFTFHLRATAEDDELMSDTRLEKKGHGLFGNSGSIGSILTAPTTDDLRLVVFEFFYLENSGGDNNNSSTIYHTVARMDSPLLQLPKFMLEPASLLTKAKTLVGFKGVDFAEHPAFMSVYHLAGEHEPALRRIFTPPLIRYCEAHPGLTIEGRGERLIVYRQQRLKAEILRAFLDEAKKVLSLFVQAGVSSSSAKAR
jgi:hypothetical protein